MSRLPAAMDAAGPGDHTPRRGRDRCQRSRDGDQATHEATVYWRRRRRRVGGSVIVYRRTSAPPRTFLRPVSTPGFALRSLSTSRFTLPVAAACTYLLLLQAISVHGSSLGDTRPVTQCTKVHPMVGFEADLSMNQHQLRGTIRILDDCTFRVRTREPNVLCWTFSSQSSHHRVPPQICGSSGDPASAAWQQRPGCTTRGPSSGLLSLKESPFLLLPLCSLLTGHKVRYAARITSVLVGRAK